MARILDSSSSFLFALALASCGLFVEPPEVEQPLNEAVGSTGGRSTSGFIESNGGQSPDESCGPACGSSTTTPTAGASGLPIDDNDCVDECDCDDDGHLSKACGGDDCDDHDPRVHPGQTEYQEESAANPAIGFDYDCSGELERDPDQPVVDCGLLDLLLCKANEGFQGALPECGEAGTWVRCAPGVLGLTCTHEPIGNVVARCH